MDKNDRLERVLLSQHADCFICLSTPKKENTLNVQMNLLMNYESVLLQVQHLYGGTRSGEWNKSLR